MLKCQMGLLEQKLKKKMRRRALKSNGGDAGFAWIHSFGDMTCQSSASFNYHIKSVNYALIISVFNAKNKRPFTSAEQRRSLGRQYLQCKEDVAEMETRGDEDILVFRDLIHVAGTRTTFN